MLKYYVLNHDFNKDEIVNFNIFDNIILERETVKEVKRYLRAPRKYKCYSLKEQKYIYGFDGFVEELRTLIMWQEWGRCEYEILVSGTHTRKVEPEKWDCYMQALPNIEAIAREVIYQYKQSVNKSHL